MVIEIIPFSFELNTTAIAGSCLWSFALYIGLTRVRIWLIEQLERWFNWAERFLYWSEKEFEKTRNERQHQNTFNASLLSILPFLLLGGLCNYGVELSLGNSWSVSTGLLACAIFGVYQLGKYDQTN